MKKFDYIVYIGRFQPLHIAHVKTIEKALSLANKVIVFIGSANQPRTVKNPFTWEERADMILNTVGTNNEKLIQLAIRPLEDAPYNNQKWINWVQSEVDQITREYAALDDPNADYNLKIGIIGFEKDGSSFYLKMFPQWEFVGMENINHINATDIRNTFFNYNSHKWNETSDIVPKPVYDWMNEFIVQQPKEYSKLVDEFKFIRDYKLQWEAAPYPPTFVTVDAVVIQSGHVLMVVRGAQPGKGLYALPGGFVGQSEFIEDAMVRELREETRLKVPDPVLHGSIKASKFFDDPNRSLRGRTITVAYCIELASGELPKIKGSDDAAKARWIQLAELNILKDQIFEDHYAIIMTMLGYL